MDDLDAARDRITLGRREGLQRAAAGGEDHRRGARGRPRHRGRAVPPRRPGVQGDHPALGHGSGRHPAAARVERHLYGESYLHDVLAVRLGGRAAERAVFGEASTGATDDLAGATSIAVRMVREFGLSDVIGPVGYGDGSPNFLPQTADLTPGRTRRAPNGASTPKSGVCCRRPKRGRWTCCGHTAGALDRLTEQLLRHETVDGGAVRAALERTGGTAQRILITAAESQIGPTGPLPISAPGGRRACCDGNEDLLRIVSGPVHSDGDYVQTTRGRYGGTTRASPRRRGGSRRTRHRSGSPWCPRGAAGFRCVGELMQPDATEVATGITAFGGIALVAHRPGCGRSTPDGLAAGDGGAAGRRRGQRDQRTRPGGGRGGRVGGAGPVLATARVLRTAGTGAAPPADPPHRGRAGAGPGLRHRGPAGQRRLGAIRR